VNSRRADARFRPASNPAITRTSESSEVARKVREVESDRQIEMIILTVPQRHARFACEGRDTDRATIRAFGAVETKCAVGRELMAGLMAIVEM
jgi:hypothetical protein